MTMRYTNPRLLYYFTLLLFCHTMLASSTALAVMCVCLSVTFMDCVQTNKRIFTSFSPSSSHTILEFPYQMAWQYSDGNPLTGASNAGGVGRNCDAELHRML